MIQFEKYAFIKETHHEPHRGGDLDFVMLKDGTVLIISIEGIGRYESFDSWVDGDSSIGFISSEEN